MKDFFLSLRAEILILKEQNARIKAVKQQIKLANFYNKYENELYRSKSSVLRQLQIIKKLAE
nr:hypothetical protein [uncultured Schaedlerella sp.]